MSTVRADMEGGGNIVSRSDERRKHAQWKRSALAALGLLWCGQLGAGEIGTANAAPNETVTKQQYDALQQRVRNLEQQLHSREAAPPASPTAGSSLQDQINDLKQEVSDNRLGTTKFLLTGTAFGNFEAPQHGNSTFNAGFSPIFLWELNDQLLFEGEVEFEIEDSDTVTKLEYAQILYSPFDFLTVGAGKFLSPLNQFVERYEPRWINRLADAPLAFYDSILPESEVGVQLRGGVPVGPARARYALYLSNGPKLSDANPGQLDFDNFTDNNKFKAFGGHFGVLPIPEMELGYGFETSRVADSGADDELDVFLQTVDLNVTSEVPALAGRMQFLAQWAWSNLDRGTFSLEDESTTTFKNDQNGGYFQLSYRPTLVDATVLRNFELVTRYDRLDVPGSVPDGRDENRVALGVDYWLDSNTVLKTEYELDQVQHGSDNDRALVELATGF